MQRTYAEGTCLLCLKNSEKVSLSEDPLGDRGPLSHQARELIDSHIIYSFIGHEKNFALR